MRYELSYFEKVQILMRGTCIDCVPHFKITLKDNVELIKLQNALKEALIKHPIFATRLIYDKKYYLESNNQDVVIEETNNKPRTFGKTTNGYLWKVTYLNNVLEFDFCHAITDGRGMARFVTSVLESYYDLPISYETEPYINAFDQTYEKKCEPLTKIDKQKGFSNKDLGHIKNMAPTKLTVFSLKTEQLLKTAKKVDSTPAAIILPLLSKAVYHSLPDKCKNHNVRGYFTADFRKAMNKETGMNYIGYQYLTYTSRLEKYDLEALATIYRGVMDLFLQKENITYFCTNFVEKVKFIVDLKPTWLAHRLLKLFAPLEKKDTNVYLTYIGKLPFSQELTQHIKDVEFIVYPDTGYCAMAAVDFNGTMKLSLCNNYKTDNIEDNFTKLLKDNGVDINNEPTILYKQACLML